MDNNRIFNLDRYQQRIEQSLRRLAIARSFQEPDQLPVLISVGGPFFCAQQGVDIAEYYQDRELALEVQIRGQQWAFEELEDDRTSFGIYLDLGSVYEGMLFGAEIVRPQGNPPWSRPVLTDPGDVEKLELPDLTTNPAIQWFYREKQRLEELAQQRGLAPPVGGQYFIHAPLSAACALAGAERVYQWMYEVPQIVHDLMAKCLCLYCRLIEYYDSLTGTHTQSAFLADDNSAFVSEPMYRQFVLPYNRVIYERYGMQGRYLHADGPNDHLFSLYADELHLTEMDIGGFSDISTAKRAMAGKTVISGGLNCKDVYGDFAAAQPIVERAVAIGAPGGGYIFGIGGGTYAGVNPHTLVQAVSHAQQISRK